MTDTIGWGDDDRPRRSSRLRPRLNRRRRVALVAVAALVGAGVVAWPSFRSWRAGDAAWAVERIWARAQGFDNSRVLVLSNAQRNLGTLDRAEFARAVATTDLEEAGDLDRLASQAKAIRPWAPDVAAARDAVVVAMVAQARALRTQANDQAAIPIALVVTTSIDDAATAAADDAATLMGRLQSRHHVKDREPTTEQFPSAAGILAALRRPTDQPLHLRLVASGSDGITVTDLDTGRVLLRRALDTNDAVAWEPIRLAGNSVLGNVDSDTLVIPLTWNGPERLIRKTFVQSSAGSPIWLGSYLGGSFEAIDDSGRHVGPQVRWPHDLSPTGVGSASVLLMSTQSTDATGGPAPVPAASYLFSPRNGHLARLATKSCGQLPGFGGDLFVVPTGPQCDFATRLQLFDVSGRLVRTVALPGDEVMQSSPICSPDGRQVAVLTSPPSSLDGDTPPPTTRLLDTRTGAWTTLRTPPQWIPLGWSSDSRTLLMQFTDSGQFDSVQQFGHLGYVRLGDPTLHSIRVAADLGNFLS